MTTEDQFQYKEGSTFDFTNAAVFRKTSTLSKSNVEVATEAQDVVTMINGKEETRNKADAGDSIITGPFGVRYT